MSNNPRHLRPALTVIDGIIKYFAEVKKEQNKKVQVLQVGANDGITDDPINKYITKENWAAVLVEPQTYVFENELKKTYDGFKNVAFENVAIGVEEGELPFYQLSFTKKKWATGLASFVKSCLQDHIDRGYVYRKSLKDGITPPEKIEDYIEEVKVKVDTFDNILQRNGFNKVDFLCIDTEGYDYQVLKMFDFDKYDPQMVLFESKNLNDDDFSSSKELLEKNGFKLFWQKGNTLAVKLHIPVIKKFNLGAKALFEKI